MKKGNRFSIITRLVALCMCACIGMTSIPIKVHAEEKTHKVTVTTTDEMAEPTEFPAEGTMYVQIFNKYRTDDDVISSFDEAFLPVMVDKNKTVYAELDTLARYLRMKVATTTDEHQNTVKVVQYYNSKLFLKDKTHIAGYQMSTSKAGKQSEESIYPYITFSLGNICFIKDNTFYVPLDAFLECTGSFSFYAGEREDGKSDLYIIAPQETALDYMLYFYEDAFDEYFFSIVDDLGYTQEGAINTYKSAMGVQCFQRLGTIFDWAIYAGILTQDDKHIDNKYVDKFMSCALHVSEDVINQIHEDVENGTGVLSIVAEIFDEDVLVQSKTIVNKGAKDFIKSFGNALDLCDDKLKVLGPAADFAFICANMYGIDQISMNGAYNFINSYRGLTNIRTIDDDNVKRVQKNINNYSGNLSWGALKIWIEEYWMSLGGTFGEILMEVKDKGKGIGQENLLGLAGFASSVWSVGTNILFGKILDSTESYMTAYFGEQYEMEVVTVARECIKACINGNLSEQTTRDVVYHALASCHATRYFGLDYAEERMKKKHNADAWEVFKKNEDKNAALSAEVMSVMKSGSVAMGLIPSDFGKLDINEKVHYDNVYFNICQIYGRILKWDKEKPAKNLEVWVTDETGAVLTEFVTDKAGDFDVAFEVKDVSIFDNGSLKKLITFHIDESRYPEIMETVEIELFKKSRIDGLRAGRKEEKITCLLEDVNEENGKLILDVRRITIKDKDKVFNLNMPMFLSEGDFETYILRPSDYELSDTIERIILEDKMSFETIYSRMYPDGTFAGEMMQLFGSEIKGTFDTGVLINSDLNEVNEIWSFIEEYKKINKNYPTYEITKVNSVIDSIDPILIQFSN